MGKVPNTPEGVRKLVQRLGPPAKLLTCYEAGPLGYGLHRLLTGMGVRCVVVAPALTPVRPGDQVKTDRRDAVRLAQLLRAGELTPVWVPGEEEEALRELVRAREAAKRDLRRARQALNSFLLRHGAQPPQGTRRWSRVYLRWLDTLSFPHRAAQVVFQELLHAVRELEARLEELTAQAEDLRRSRERLVTARDEERRRLEREIREGPERHLLTMRAEVDRAAGLAPTDPAEAGAVLEELGYVRGFELLPKGERLARSVSSTGASSGTSRSSGAYSSPRPASIVRSSAPSSNVCSGRRSGKPNARSRSRANSPAEA